MKSSWPPFSAAARSHSTSSGSIGASTPSRSVIRTESDRISTTWFSATGTNVRVRWSTAGMSEASMFSPRPNPTISGEETLTPTITPGSSAEVTTSAYAPVSCLATARMASARPEWKATSSSIRWATTSVSVSEPNRCPSFSRRVLSGWKFSMIPLWMTAMRPEQSRWGWAFSSVGGPWVAHRVWPIPTVPATPPRSPRTASSSPSLPARFTTERSPSIRATPAES